MTTQGVTHPAVQVAAASAIAAGFPSDWGIWLAVPAALYYCYLLAKEIATAPTGALGTLVAKLKSTWIADKPYLVAGVGLVFAAAQAFHYPIPDWAITTAAFLGVATFHSMSKGPTKP